MFYNKWWIYQKVYLKSLRKRQVKKYLEQVNKEEKPLYIHINKTAGSSIAKSLNITEIHHTLEEYEILFEKQFGKPIPSSIEIVASIRNPFDKIASQYFYRIKTNQNQLGQNTLPFDEWVRLAFDKKDPFYRDWERMFDTQNSWIKNSKNHPISIIRFENLNEDFIAIAKKYNGNTLTWKKKSSNKNYKECYSDYSRNIIAKEFKEDLERFNYSF